jgi:hypothetical protein
MLLGRDGTVGIHSGGASNHAGSSEGPWQSSKGTVPTSSANSRMLGIEAQNAGTGSEPWAPVMLDAYEILVAALCDAYQLDPFRDLPAHAVAGPGWTARKVDPLGDTPDPAAHPYAARDATWDMHQFWSIVAARMGGAPPPGGDDEMPKPFMSALIQATGADGTLPGAVYLTDQIGMTFHWVPNETTLKDRRHPGRRQPRRVRRAHRPRPQRLVQTLGWYVAVTVVALASLVGTITWWLWRRSTEKDARTVISLLRDILTELRRLTHRDHR